MDQSDVSISSASMDLRLAWKQVAFLWDTPRGLMFMLPNTQVLCWLPQRLFDGSTCKLKIMEYATANNIAVRQMD